MDDHKEPFETLKQLLKNARDPDALNDHPWVESLFVQDAVTGDPQLQHARPGGQLVTALADLFPQMMPSTPPRRGKRLDPRWGSSACWRRCTLRPSTTARPIPATLLDAWGRIDEAILYFVYGKPAGELGAEEVEKYRLVGDDLEYGSASTLSDWHRKGLQRFTEIILDQERYLSRTQGRPSPLLAKGAGDASDIPAKTAQQTSWTRLVPGLGGAGRIPAGRAGAGLLQSLADLRARPAGLPGCQPAAGSHGWTARPGNGPLGAAAAGDAEGGPGCLRRRGAAAALAESPAGMGAGIWEGPHCRTCPARAGGPAGGCRPACLPGRPAAAGRGRGRLELRPGQPDLPAPEGPAAAGTVARCAG